MDVFTFVCYANFCTKKFTTSLREVVHIFVKSRISLQLTGYYGAKLTVIYQHSAASVLLFCCSLFCSFNLFLWLLAFLTSIKIVSSKTTVKYKILYISLV